MYVHKYFDTYIEIFAIYQTIRSVDKSHRMYNLYKKKLFKELSKSIDYHKIGSNIDYYERRKLKNQIVDQYRKPKT